MRIQDAATCAMRTVRGGLFLMRAYCAPLGIRANSILVHNLAAIELTARLGADINQ